MTEIKHYGVKGMKWGVIRQKLKKRRLNKETRKLVEDSKTVTAKAEPGKTRMVTGNYMQKRNGQVYLSNHIVDEFGKVKLSYINGTDGRHFVAAGRDYINKLDLHQYFYKTDGIYEYDVYK